MANPNPTAVKVVYEWRVPANGRDAFTQWLEQTAADAAAAEGYEGSSVFSSHEDWLLLVRFADRAALERWQALPATQQRMASVAAFARPGSRAQHRIGLETWFTLPGAPAKAAPPRWKMALVTWCALLPQVLLIGEILPREWPKLARAMVGTLIPVVMLAYVVMPWLTQLLHRWLFPPERRADA